MQRRTALLAAGGLVGGWGAAQVVNAPAAAAATAGTTVFDVRQYGAAGDGATDDTKAFQDALSAARAVPGGSTLLIPPGTYAVAQGLVRLRGWAGGSGVFDDAVGTIATGNV